MQPNPLLLSGPQQLPMLRIFDSCWHEQECDNIDKMQLTLCAPKEALEAWAREEWKPSGEPWERTLALSQAVELEIYVLYYRGGRSYSTARRIDVLESNIHTATMENVVLELKKAVAGFDIDKDLHGWARSEREWGLQVTCECKSCREPTENTTENLWWGREDKETLERIKPWYADAQPNPLLVMGWQQHPMMQIFHNEPLIMWRNNYLDGGIQLKCGIDYSMVREWVRKHQDWVPGGESWGDTLIADRNVEVFITLHVQHGRDLPLAQEPDLPSMASSLDEHITMPSSKRRCHEQPSDVPETHATPPAQSNINVKASATTSTRDPSKSAEQQVFAIVELVEMILRQFGGRPEMKALYAVTRVSRTFQQTMASSTALRKAMWLEYEVLPRNARDESDAGSDGDDLEDESESEVGDEDGEGKDLDDDDEAGDEEDHGGWANGATTNPLVVPVNLNNKPGLVMLSQFNALDDNLDHDGRVAIDFHTDLDLHDWIAEYKHWKPSGASWERTFISDRPVSIDVHLLFDFDMEFDFVLEPAEDTMTVGWLMQTMQDLCFWQIQDMDGPGDDYISSEGSPSQ
nr:hypothetical protein B0A51_06070 [Rachicladosporium sp. CCFEE 5018]